MRRITGILIVFVLGGIYSQQSSAEVNKLMLKHGWSVQSSAKVKEGGEAISKVGFNAQTWYPATVPNTVLAVLTENRVYTDDPYFGMNLRKIPGNFPKPFDTYVFPKTFNSPFRKPWWYRTEFQIPDEYDGKRICLHFNGINFKANIWLNGKKLADSEDVSGPFRVFEFDITELVQFGKTNALAVEVFAPTGQDLAINWVDWNPAPPDKNMGLWREVYLTFSGPVVLRYPAVLTELEVPSLAEAHLTVLCEVKNLTAQEVSGILRGAIGDTKFSQEVKLGPKEIKTMFFSPEKFPQLNVRNPRLWWPSGLGHQNLYELNLEFESNGQLSDRQSIKFGIREVSSEFTEEGYRLFKINGKRILIRGAGWAPDMMLRFDRDRLEDEVRYVKEMNLNTIRLEGKLEFDEFYEICDQEGILVMPGWCCCDRWERWSRWKEKDYKIAMESEKDQCLRLRSHPSVFVWLNGSDFPPPYKVEKMYLDTLQECHWQNPVVSSASEADAEFSGPSGVKMTGPYEYVVPVYWYADKKRGGAWGFNTETSPGPAVPPIESLKRMLPADKLWPINKVWDYHSGRGVFGNTRVFTDALNKRYGEAKDVEDYAKKSQAMTYEAERAMFEAFGRNKYTATGVIQWMLNTAWPGLIWHLYDYYLRPGGGYFGTKRGCEPLHIQYGYDDNSVSVVNSFYQDFQNLKAIVKVYNFDLSEKFSQEKILNIPEDSSVKVLTLPEISGLSTTYFLKLELLDAESKLISSNFYWLSTVKEEPDWIASLWYVTPTKSFADFKELQNLPQVELNASVKFEKGEVVCGQECPRQEGKAIVAIENPSKSLAFMVRLKINKGKAGEEILPVFWEDNYFSLLPGEKREITARYYLKDLGDAVPSLEVTGWNIKHKEY